MKLTLANVKELKRNSSSPLFKRVCNYFIDRRGDYNDNGIISIDSAVTELPVRNSEGKIVDHRTVISDTKTAASVREVPMPNILKATLLEWKKSRWVQQRTTDKSFIGPNDLVFANNEGELRTYTGTKTIFQRLMRQNGLAPYKLHFHSLRHTYSSMLFESRENPKVI